MPHGDALWKHGQSQGRAYTTQEFFQQYFYTVFSSDIQVFGKPSEKFFTFKKCPTVFAKTNGRKAK